MQCPDDHAELVEKPAGIVSCPRCRGMVFSQATFGHFHSEATQTLKPEQNLRSGAFARLRACPQCQEQMKPLRLGALLAWLDVCEKCNLLWVEQLDQAVIQGIKQRHARRGAID